MPRAKTPKSQTGTVRAVERAIEILQAFSNKSSMSVLEIQKAVGLSRPTLYRILKTLASKGLVRAHDTPQRFSLDYAVGGFAQSWLSGLDIVAAARPILERLHEESKETVGLMQCSRDQQSMCLGTPVVLTSSQYRAELVPWNTLGRGASG